MVIPEERFEKSYVSLMTRLKYVPAQPDWPIVDMIVKGWQEEWFPETFNEVSEEIMVRIKSVVADAINDTGIDNLCVYVKTPTHFQTTNQRH